MAECAVQQITITGSSVAGINGTYTKSGTENGLSRYIKDGQASLPKIYGQIAGPPGYEIWTLLYANGSWIFSQPGQLVTDCPPEGQSQSTGGGATGTITLAYVAAAPSAPTFGLPADVVALITARFGTVANFLRLRHLGYI